MSHLTNKDFVSGLIFVGAGLIGLMLSLNFDFGSTARPGPGFFPIVLSVLLVLIGLAVAVSSMLATADPIAEISVRPVVFIISAVCTFALGIETIGLMPTVFVATLIASFARPNFGTRDRLLLAAGLSGFSALLFVGGLNLPIKLWAF